VQFAQLQCIIELSLRKPQGAVISDRYDLEAFLAAIAVFDPSRLLTFAALENCRHAS
jgi:hypothetical protein